MQPALILAVVQAALALVEQLAPAIKALKQSAELTPEQEAELDARIAALKDLPHWRVRDPKA